MQHEDCAPIFETVKDKNNNNNNVNFILSFELFTVIFHFYNDRMTILFSFDVIVQVR